MSATQSFVKDLPAIPDEIRRSNPELHKALVKLREAVQVSRGFRGDPLDRALTLRDVADQTIPSGGLGGSTTPGPTGPAGPPGPPGAGVDPPDLTPPPTPTGLAAVAGFTKIQITWDAPVYTQGHGHARTNIYAASQAVGSSDPPPVFGDAVKVASTTVNQFALVTNLSVKWFIWIKWESVDGVESVSPAGGTNGVQAQTGKIGNVDLGPLIVEAGNLADGSVSATKLANGAVGLTKFAAGLTPVEIVSTLPSTGNFAGRMAILTTDGKLYRYTSGAWTRFVESADITGQLTDAQLQAISAAKVTGQLVASQLAVSIGGGNLITNSSFEVDTNGDGWSDGWGIYTGVTTPSLVSDARHGSKAQRVLTTGGVLVPRVNQQTSRPPVEAGATYRLSCWMKAPAGNTLFLSGKVTAASNGGTELWQAPGTTAAATGAWQRLVTTIQPGNTGYFMSTPGLTGTPAAGVELLIDAIQLEVGDIETSYAPRPDEILPGSINSTEIADGAISAIKTNIAAISAATGNLNAGTVNAAQLVANAVTSTALAAGAVTAAKTAVAAIDPSSGNLVANSVTATQIAAGAVVAGKIAANAVTANEIAANSIGATEIAAGAVTTAKLAAGAVTANEIAADAVTAAKIVAGAVVAGKIAAGAVSATEIAAGAVTTAKLAAAAVTANEIAAGAVVADKIAANAVTTPKLEAGAVTTAKLAVGAVTANELAANSVIAGKIAAGAVNADQLVAGAVRTDKLLVTGRGAELNADPNAMDSSAWNALSGTSQPQFVSGLTDIPSGGSTAMQNATGSSSFAFCSELIPVDQAKNYRAQVVLKRQAGSGDATYCAIAWYDAAGTFLASNQSQPTGAGNPAGWSNGTFSYFGLTGGSAPTTWTPYTTSFGPAEVAKIPSNAKFMRIGALLNNTGVGGVQIRATGIRLAEKAAADLIVDGSIVATKLAAGAIAVGSAAIANGAISNAMLGTAIVDTANIADASIVNGKIANLAVDSAKIAAAAITTAKIGDLQVTGAKIANATIVDANIGSLNASKIIAGTMDAARITAGTITTDRIQVGAATASAAQGDEFEGVTISAGSETFTTSAYTIIPSFVCTGAAVTAMATVSGAIALSNTNVASVNVVAHILRDGATILETSFARVGVYPVAAGRQAGFCIPVLWRGTPAAGAHSFQVQLSFQWFGADGFPVQSDGSCNLRPYVVVQENKV
jgi:hypothetical protein